MSEAKPPAFTLTLITAWAIDWLLLPLSPPEGEGEWGWGGGA